MGEPASNVRPLRPDAPPAFGDWRDLLLYKSSRDRGMVIDPIPANAVTILRHAPEWSGVLAFDELEQAVVSRAAPPWHETDAPREAKPGPWSDADTTRAMNWLRRRYSIQLGAEAVWAAVSLAAEAASFNPVREWIEGLAWDGVARVGRPAAEDDAGVPGWLSTLMGAPDTAYARAVSRWWAVSAVARVYKPGCKVDTVPILEGPQGARKGTVLRALVGDAWYSDTPLDLASKDRFTSLRGVWVQELAEFDQYGKHEASVLKAFASSQVDKYRPPYGRVDVRAPRRCVLVATINPGREYLADETGGRRWWPVRVSQLDDAVVEKVRAAREVFWAEAREIFTGGARWWPDGTEESRVFREEQELRATSDVWEPKIADWARGHQPGACVTVAQVLSGAMGLEPGKWDERAAQRAARCLRELGWVRERDGAATAGGRRGYHYRLVGVGAGG